MLFGDYDEELVYQIENSTLHRAVGDGVRTVEFIFLQKDEKLLFVEAKFSSPRKETGPERFDEFISEICEKFVHSFDMYCAAKLERYSDLTGRIKEADDKKVRYKFVLVINGHKEEWLLPLQDILNKKLLYHKRIWKTSVVVVNESGARKYGLLSIEKDT